METWGETLTLYRAVSLLEHRQLRASGRLRQLGGAEGKYFAEQEAHARAWGQALFGEEQYRIVQVDFPKHVADRFHRFLSLDGIGPARFARLDQLETYEVAI
jgi:hypothetical protein